MPRTPAENVKRARQGPHGPNGQPEDTANVSAEVVCEQYKDSDNEEKQSWAEQAKMRANKTASTYNTYILKNSYVWKNNIPADIYMTLEYIE